MFRRGDMPGEVSGHSTQSQICGDGNSGTDLDSKNISPASKSEAGNDLCGEILLAPPMYSCSLHHYHLPEWLI